MIDALPAFDGGQRIGAAAGIALVGAVFFAQVANSGGDWARAFQIGLATAAVLVLIALAVGLADHFAHRRDASADVGARSV